VVALHVQVLSDTLLDFLLLKAIRVFLDGDHSVDQQRPQVTAVVDRVGLVQVDLLEEPLGRLVNFKLLN
jgi:hypothetical protein